MKRPFGCLCLIGMGVLGFACMGIELPGDFLGNLLIGWIFFLQRVAPVVSVNAGGVATAVISLSALVLGLHLFLRWFYLEIRRPLANEEHWQRRWTAAIVIVVVLMFVAGISAVGITHQTSWLLTSPEPLLNNSILGTVSRSRSMSKMRQIGTAALMHHEEKGTLPAGVTFDKHGRMLHGWQTFLLPYLEEGPLYDSINLELPWNHPDNAAAFRREVRLYQSPYYVRPKPNADGYAVSHYAGNVYLLGTDQPLRLDQITDGTSNTILAGEAAGNYQPWGYPANWRDPALGINRSPNGFGHPSRRSVIFLMADCSTRDIFSNIDPQVLKSLCTPNGGEVVPGYY